MKKLISLLLFVSLAFAFTACDDEDDPVSGGDPGTEKDAWVGTWLSADEDVAPLLVAVFNYDSVRVTLTENGTVSLESHVKDGAWTTTSGTYTVYESSNSEVDAIKLIYSNFEQEGIVQVTNGDPDELKLEAVQTVPDIGAVPRTPETGFGSDESLGSNNVQIYVRVE